MFRGADRRRTLDLHLRRRALRLRVLRRLRPGQHREVLLHRRHGARAPRAPREAATRPRVRGPSALRGRGRSARGARASRGRGAPRGNTDAAPTPEPRALECGARGATPRSTRVQPRGRNNVPSGASAAMFQITARAASRLVAKSGADEALRWQNEKKGRFSQRANSLAIVRARLAVGLVLLCFDFKSSSPRAPRALVPAPRTGTPLTRSTPRTCPPSRPSHSALSSPRAVRAPPRPRRRRLRAPRERAIGVSRRRWRGAPRRRANGASPHSVPPRPSRRHTARPTTTRGVAAATAGTAARAHSPSAVNPKPGPSASEQRRPRPFPAHSSPFSPRREIPRAPVARSPRVWEKNLTECPTPSLRVPNFFFPSLA